MKLQYTKVQKIWHAMMPAKAEHNALSFDCCPKMIIIAVPVRIRGCPAK
jgi:hypothetical protein